MVFRLGVQDNNGNEWIGPFGNGAGHGAFMTVPDPQLAQSNLFKVNNPIIGSSLHPNSLPQSWFKYDIFGVTKYCPQNYFCFNIPDPDWGSPEITSLDIMVASGQYEPTFFPDETESIAKHFLYEKLTSFPDLLNADPSLPVFYSAYNNSVINLQTSLMLDMEELNQYDSTFSSMLQVTDSTITIISDSLIILSSLPTSPAVNAVITTLQMQLQNLQIASANLTSQLNATRQNQLQNLILKNAAVIPVELPEINEHIINEIYLHTIAQGLTVYAQEQLGQLRSIAQQCPFAGGPAVYRARVMLEMVNPVVEYDDDATCLAQGLYRQSQPIEANRSTIKSIVTLQPNPAKDQVTITYTADDGANCLMQIYSVDGAKIEEFSLPGKQNTITFSITDLQSGLYFIKVFNDNKMLIGTGKLSVIKY